MPVTKLRVGAILSVQRPEVQTSVTDPRAAFFDAQAGRGTSESDPMMTRVEPEPVGLGVRATGTTRARTDRPIARHVTRGSHVHSVCIGVLPRV
eukprot:895565-Rhodomonas_salina.2